MAFVVNGGPAQTRRNVRQGGAAKNPGKINTLFFHKPNLDFLKIADYGDPKTAIQASLVNTDFSKRAFMIKDLIAPEKKGEDPGYEKRGQFSYKSDKGTWEYHWILNGTYADYLKVKWAVKNLRGYLVVPGDENNYVRHKTVATGARGFRIHEIEVMPLTEAVQGAVVKYTLRLALADIDEIAEADMTDLTFNPSLTLEGVEDAPITLGVSGTAGTFRITAKAMAGELDLCKEYDENTELRQSGAFSFVNNAGLAIGITAVNAVKLGNDTIAFDIVANTAANYIVNQKGYLKWSAPATIFGYIGMYLDCVELEVTLT